ncbi:multifunctional arylesterase:lysophospholipase protein [Magnetospira sp. QH-2]|nr:multifunctional arylesterase:lysophospholipase protein [Magnetospira sp. QH-2]
MAGRLVNAGLLILLLGFPAQAETLRILALGDSLTAGYGLAEKDAFTFQLEKALKARGHDIRVINAGVSGDTTAGGKTRIGWLLSDNPHVVLLELGANDGLRGLDPALTEANLDSIIHTALKKGARVLLVGMRAPPNLGPDYAVEFDPLYGRLAEKHGVVLQPFFLEGVVARPELNQNDGIHPNGEGVRLVVQGLLPYMEKVLAEIP